MPYVLLFVLRLARVGVGCGVGGRVPPETDGLRLKLRPHQTTRPHLSMPGQSPWSSSEPSLPHHSKQPVYRSHDQIEHSVHMTLCCFNYLHVQPPPPPPPPPPNHIICRGIPIVGVPLTCRTEGDFEQMHFIIGCRKYSWYLMALELAYSRRSSNTQRDHCL